MYKRARIVDDNVRASATSETSPAQSYISFMPTEIMLEIFSYLSYSDLDNVKRVSSFFKRVAHHPLLWRKYEVRNNERTLDVITALKRMPQLRTISIETRVDSDHILRQLSISNKNLEELRICNCTGSTAKLYLNPAYLTRILERCHRLHTITIFGSIFRGQKFYRQLAGLGMRLQVVSMMATPAQFRAFVTHAEHITDADRATVVLHTHGTRARLPFHYYVMDTSTALITFVTSDVVLFEPKIHC